MRVICILFQSANIIVALVMPGLEQFKNCNNITTSIASSSSLAAAAAAAGELSLSLSLPLLSLYHQRHHRHTSQLSTNEAIHQNCAPATPNAFHNLLLPVTSGSPATIIHRLPKPPVGETFAFAGWADATPTAPARLLG